MEEKTQGKELFDISFALLIDDRELLEELRERLRVINEGCFKEDPMSMNNLLSVIIRIGVLDDIERKLPHIHLGRRDSEREPAGRHGIKVADKQKRGKRKRGKEE